MRLRWLAALCLLTAPASAQEVLRDCATCPEMVVVPAGSFQMGSPPEEVDRGADEGPMRRVIFTRPFAIGATEVTIGQFTAFIAATGHETPSECLIWAGSELALAVGRDWRDPGYPVTNAHPVACVSWRDAAAYAAWLAETTGEPYRLPSEAEWEYAARGGASGAYSFAGGLEAVCRYGNVSDASAQAAQPAWNAVPCDDGVGFGTGAVASYAPNGFGLFDTVGNLWEFVADCYRDSYEGAPKDGSAWGDAGECGRPLDRGGGFSNVFPGHLRIANRSAAPSADIAVYSLGFRVARDLPQGTE